MRNARESLDIRVIGKPAVGILLVVAAIFTLRPMVTRYTVNPNAEHAIRNLLAAKYLETDMPDFKARLEQGEVEVVVERRDYHMSSISFPSMSSRGGRARFCVRAEILVDGVPPPHGKSVRYFRISKSPSYGHIVEDETVALSYYLPFLD